MGRYFDNQSLHNLGILINPCKTKLQLTVENVHYENFSSSSNFVFNWEFYFTIPFCDQPVFYTDNCIYTFEDS